MSRGATRVIAVVALLAAVLGVAARAQWVAGARAMRASDEASSHGDLRGAIASAREAAMARVPFSPYPGRAFGRLEDIARQAEQSHDLPTATLAWDAVRAAALSTRALFSGNDRLARDADEGLARVGAAQGLGPAEVEAARARLAEDPAPSPALAVGLAALLALLAAAAVQATRRSPAS